MCELCDELNGVLCHTNGQCRCQYTRLSVLVVSRGQRHRTILLLTISSSQNDHWVAEHVGWHLMMCDVVLYSILIVYKTYVSMPTLMSSVKEALQDARRLSKIMFQCVHCMMKSHILTKAS